MFWILFSVNQQLTQDFRIRSLNNFSFSTQQYTSFFPVFCLRISFNPRAIFSEIATMKPSVKNKFVCVCAIEPDIWKYPFHYSGYIKRNTFFSLCHLFKKILGSWNCKVWMFFLRGSDFWSLIKQKDLSKQRRKTKNSFFRETSSTFRSLIISSIFDFSWNHFHENFSALPNILCSPN